MFLPDFLGIGAQRAATTWVYHCLIEHPQIYVPACKEIHYFDTHYHRGASWYAGHFTPRLGHRTIGEVTPNYLDHEKAASRMARMLPDARLFVILRDPAERALSAYRFFRQFRGLSFAEACREPYLIELGRYAKHLKRIFAYYPREQVKIILYDDVLREPGLVMSDLYHYLDVDDSFVPPSLPILYNHARLRTADGLPGSLGRITDRVKRHRVVRWLRRWLGPQVRSSRYGTIADKVLDNVRAVFQEDVLELQELIGCDCSGWLPSPCTKVRKTSSKGVGSNASQQPRVSAALVSNRNDAPG